LRLLFGIANDDEYSLASYIEVYSGRMPDNILPIGSDDFGNVVCLSVMGEDIGKVYFWNHDWEVVERTADYSNMTLMANSFSEFIEGLYFYI